MPTLTGTVCGGAYCIGSAFLILWTIFSIVGAIHYSKWPPKFDLTDVHIRSFNVTPSYELNYDMDIHITARHFSSIRRIERYSYKFRTSHVEKRIGSSSIPGFHPIHNETMALTTTQTVSLLPLGDSMGDLVRKDLNSTGRVAIRIYMEGQIYTPLFLAMKKRRGLTCDLIVSPGLPFGSQIYDRLCCGEFRCLRYTSSGQSELCSDEALNCCLLPPSSLSSTISICG